MLLRSFQVQGFANFTQPLALGPLEDVNVIGGGNNTGKSNLLRAVELYFRVLGSGDEVSGAYTRPLGANDPELRRLLEGAFNRRHPQPITFEVEWSVSPDRLAQAGMKGRFSTDRVLTELTVAPADGPERPPQVRVLRWTLGDLDAASPEQAQNGPLQAFARDLRQLLAGAPSVPATGTFCAFAWIGREAGLFPQSVRDALFDARHSIDSRERRRWSLFRELADALQPELGAGEWDMTFRRSTGAADLLYVTPAETLILEQMGAGAQHLLRLLAELCLSRAGWAAAEEPEQHLSLGLQQRFVTLARKVLQRGVGPRQLLMSTHSPTLAGLCSPFVLRREGDAPRLERRLWGVSDRGGPVKGARADDSHGEEQRLDALIGLVDELAELDPADITGDALEK